MGCENLHRPEASRPRRSTRAQLDDPRARDIQRKYDYVERYMDTMTYTRFVAEQVAEQKIMLEKIGLAKKE